MIVIAGIVVEEGTIFITKHHLGEEVHDKYTIGQLSGNWASEEFAKFGREDGYF